MTSLADIRQRIEKGCGKEVVWNLVGETANCGTFTYLSPEHKKKGIAFSKVFCSECKAQLKGFDEGVKAKKDEIEGEMKTAIKDEIDSVVANSDYKGVEQNAIIYHLATVEQKLLGVDTHSRSTEKEVTK